MNHYPSIFHNPGPGFGVIDAYISLGYSIWYAAALACGAVIACAGIALLVVNYLYREDR